MQWLVSNAQPQDSLFFHCEFTIYLTSLDWRIKQTLVTVVGQRISMVMQSMGSMTVCLSSHYNGCVVDFTTVIYPVDFNENSHILDDVRLFALL